MFIVVILCLTHTLMAIFSPYKCIGFYLSLRRWCRVVRVVARKVRPEMNYELDDPTPSNKMNDRIDGGKESEDEQVEHLVSPVSDEGLRAQEQRVAREPRKQHAES